MGNTLAGAMDEPQSSLQVGHEIRLVLFGHTDVGQIREHNEDNFLIADLGRTEQGLGEEERELRLGESGMVLAVCDGMGGAAAGEVASKMAVEILHEKLRAPGAPQNRDALARRLVSAIKDAGVHIFQDGRSDRKLRGMGTTATVATLIDDRLFLGQVGDSRAYVLRGQRLVQVTRDQSLVNQLIEAGQLTEEEAETFEHNNIILQALGTADVVQVDLTYVDLRRGDTLLMCSDGLSGMLRAEEIREILLDLEDPRAACKELVDRANLAGGHDNVTVLIARFDGEGLSPPSENDTLAYAKYTLSDSVSEKDALGPNSGTADSHGLDEPTTRSTLSEDYEPAQEEPTEISGSPAQEPSVKEGPPSSARASTSIEPPESLSLAGAIVMVALGAVALLGVWLLR